MIIMICNIVGKEYIPQLKELWKDCYPEDSSDYIDMFFNEAFPKIKCVAGLDNNKIIGVIYLFPCTILDGMPAFYFYAGAVFRSLRGNGYYRKIIDFAIKHSRDMGREFVCHPLPHLIDFYENMGFTEKYYHAQLSYNLTDIKSKIKFKMVDLTAQEAFTMMRKTAGRGYILWDSEIMDYILMDYKFINGICRKIIVNDKEEYYIFARKETDCIKITETSMPPKLIKEFANELINEYNGNKLTAQVFLNEGDEKHLSCVSSKHIDSSTKWFTLIMF